ncbi:hypothetical protein GCM10027342_33060 [Photobacterium alginatilyticum]
MVECISVCQLIKVGTIIGFNLALLLIFSADYYSLAVVMPQQQYSQLRILLVFISIFMIIMGSICYMLFGAYVDIEGIDLYCICFHPYDL